MRQMLLAGAARRQIGRAQRVAAPVDVDHTAVDRASRGVAQERLRTALRFAAPVAERVRGAQCGCDVVGEFQLRVVLHRVRLAGRAEQQPWLVARVRPGHRPRDRGAGIAGGPGRDQLVGKAQRLRLARKPVHVEPPRPRLAAVAERRAALAARVARIGAVQLVALRRAAELHVAFERLGHARHEVDDGTRRIAGVGRGKRAVEHVDALDLLGRDERPARREAGAIAEQVRQQHAVRVNERACAVAGARCARGKHRMIVVADVALAHEQAREVLERVFGVGGVDRLFDFAPREAEQSRRDLERQRHRAIADDADPLQRFHFDGGELPVGALRAVGCGQGERDRGTPQESARQRRS